MRGHPGLAAWQRTACNLNALSRVPRLATDLAGPDGGPSFATRRSGFRRQGGFVEPRYAVRGVATVCMMVCMPCLVALAIASFARLCVRCCGHARSQVAGAGDLMIAGTWCHRERVCRHGRPPATADQIRLPCGLAEWREPAFFEIGNTRSVVTHVPTSTRHRLPSHVNHGT